MCQKNRRELLSSYVRVSSQKLVSASSRRFVLGCSERSAILEKKLRLSFLLERGIRENEKNHCSL